MINLEQALLILIVAQVVGSVIMYFVTKREIRVGIDALFGNPVVKRAMGIMGSKSGEVRHDKRIIEGLAGQILGNPQLGGLKIIGKQLGIDLDEMIAEEGAADTLMGLTQIAGMLGFDLSSILSGNLKSSGDIDSSGENPYLKRR